MGARTIEFFFPVKSLIKILSAVLSIIQHVKNANETANGILFLFFFVWNYWWKTLLAQLSSVNNDKIFFNNNSVVSLFFVIF